MPDVTACYGKPFDFIIYFGNLASKRLGILIFYESIPLLWDLYSLNFDMKCY